MKIIDLLVKISKGEEVPKKVIINAGIHGIDTWVYDEHYEDYKNGADEMLLYSGMTTNHLNDEVEIIEEDKKIKFIDVWYDPIKDNKLERLDTATSIEILNNMCNDLKDKLDEVIDYLNMEK